MSNNGGFSEQQPANPPGDFDMVYARAHVLTQFNNVLNISFRQQTELQLNS